MEYKNGILNIMGDRNITYIELMEGIIEVFGERNSITEPRLNEILDKILTKKGRLIATAITDSSEGIELQYNTKSGNYQIIENN